jgi:hypothetical protein
MSQDEWPPYRVGNSDYIHALGVIASVYNLLEFRLRSFFPIYARIPTPPAHALFASLTNERRLRLIRECIPFSSHLGFPEEMQCALPNRPAPPNPLVPLLPDTQTE